MLFSGWLAINKDELMNGKFVFWELKNKDVTMMKRRILDQTYTSWIKPNEMEWDGPFQPGWHGVSPTWVQSGLSVIVAGSDEVQHVRCLFSGDVNESRTPLPNP